MIKKMMVLFICFMLVALPTFAAEAEEIVSDSVLFIAPNEEKAIQVQLNGEMIDFTDENGQIVEPKIINDRTMVPMRKIFEVFGATVDWNGEEKIITANTNDSQIILQIDNEKAVIKPISGEETEIVLDSVPVIYEDRTLVPVRFIAESLNKKVDWDASTKTVIIVDKEWIANYLQEKAPTLYRCLNEEIKMVQTYSSAGVVSGKVKYTDKDSRTNTSTLNLKGNFYSVMSGELYGIELSANITGKGALKDAIKKAGMEKITASLILDVENQELYMKSNMLDELNKDGWVKLAIPNEMMNRYQDFSEEKAENIVIMDELQKAANDISYTVDSYETIKLLLDLVCDLFKEDSFKVATKGTTDTYTWSIGVADLLKMANLEEEEIQKIEDVLSGSIEVTTSLTDGISKESESKISFEYLQEREQLAVEMKLTNEVKGVNEKVTITLPEEKEVVSYQ